MANDQNLPWFFRNKQLKNCKVAIHSLLDANKQCFINEMDSEFMI